MPAPIGEAARQAFADGHVHYTLNYGIKPLWAEIADKLSAENGIECEPDGEIVMTTGAIEAVFITMLAMVESDVEALVPDPR